MSLRLVRNVSVMKQCFKEETARKLQGGIKRKRDKDYEQKEKQG